MMTRKVRGTLTLIMFLFGLSACGNVPKNATNTSSEVNQNRDNENVNATKSLVEELSLVVNVQYEAEDVVWREDPSGKKLTAVFRYSPENSNKVVADAEKFGPPQNISLSVESWFPTELKAQGEMSGDSTVKGSVYPANGFYMGPYQTGRLTRVEGGDYFVLELNSQ